MSWGLGPTPCRCSRPDRAAIGLPSADGRRRLDRHRTRCPRCPRHYSPRAAFTPALADLLQYEDGQLHDGTWCPWVGPLRGPTPRPRCIGRAKVDGRGKETVWGLGPRHGRSWVAARGWALAVEPQAWGGPSDWSAYECRTGCSRPFGRRVRTGCADRGGAADAVGACP